MLFAFSLWMNKHSRGQQNEYYFILCSKINKEHLKWTNKIKEKIFKRFMSCLVIVVIVVVAFNEQSSEQMSQNDQRKKYNGIDVCLFGRKRSFAT